MKLFILKNCKTISSKRGRAHQRVKKSQTIYKQNQQNLQVTSQQERWERETMKEEESNTVMPKEL